MTLALACLAATGFFLVAESILNGSRGSLTSRLRQPEFRGSGLATKLAIYRDTFRARFVSGKKLKIAVAELPEILELMAVSLSAGDGIFGALARVAPRAKGVLGDSLRKMLASLELGAELDSELDWLARNLPQRQILEFTHKLSIALRRGAPLSQMLQSLAESTRAELRNDLLRQAGRNETRMLIPLVFLILPVTVLFAVYPSLQLLNIEYI